MSMYMLIHMINAGISANNDKHQFILLSVIVAFY